MILFVMGLFLTLLLNKYKPKIFLKLKEVLNLPYGYYFLFTLVLIGFYFRLDYTEQFGCFVREEPILDGKNITFSSISFVLILVSYVMRNRKMKIIFLLLELMFWLFKLFYFKGGYVVGIIGSVDLVIYFYDVLNLIVRLYIISIVTRINIKEVYIIIIALLVILIKTNVFLIA